MLARKLRKFWRRYRLQDTDEAIPAGDRSAAPIDPGAAAAYRFDPQDPAFVADPYPCFDYLRQQAPIQRGATGAWVLSRYVDISAALIDDRLGNAPSEYATVAPRNRDRYLCARVANNILPFIDPPRHAAPRKLIAHSFQRHLRQAPPPLAQTAARLLDDLPPQGEIDLLADFATPYAARVFADLLGFDDARMPQLLEWSHWFFYLLTIIPSQAARAQIDDALQSFRDYLYPLIEQRRARPESDYLSRLIGLNQAQPVMDDEQLADNLILLFADGVGNVDRGIAAAIALLLRHPQQMQRLREHPDWLPRAIDECLRFESPAQFISRVAREDLEINGQAIRRNEAVILLLASANRDPAQFEQADRFDVSRFPNPHLSFGRSRHACVGSTLVRLEMQAALTALEPILPQLELATPELSWEARMGHRWLGELRVRRGAPRDTKSPRG